MDAVPNTDLEPEADVEEVEWHGNIANPSVGGNSEAADAEGRASGVHASLPPVPPPPHLVHVRASRYSEGGGGEGKEGTAASPMEISSRSSSGSLGGNFSGEEKTGGEWKNSDGDGDNSSDTEDAKEEDPAYTGLATTYGINIDGSNRIRQPMSKIIREASKGTGIHSIINTEYYRLRHEVLQARDQPHIKTRLVEASRHVGFELTPFQVETIARAVWRPRTTLKVDYTIDSLRTPKNVSRRFSSPSSDIGSPVLVDLPPGTGKTIVCILACFLVPLERSNEIPDQAARYSSQGFAEESVSARKPHGGRVSMIFVPKHVHHQWMAAAQKAKDILITMYPNKLFFLGQNKRASEVGRAELDAGVVICDSASFGLAKALESKMTYGALCFDESTENCDVKNNAVYSQVPYDLSYGRAILISADFSKMADYNSKSSSRPGTILRKIFGDASRNHYRRAFWACQADNGCSFSKSDSDAGCKVTATLTMNAVFPANKRAEVVGACSDLLKDVSLYTFGIKYKKSVLERLGNAAANDLTSVDGNQRFKDAVGVDISECESIGDIIVRLTKIVEASKQPGMRARPKVEFGLSVLKQVDLNTTGFGSEGYNIIRRAEEYKATGTTQAPVTRKKFVDQLEKFQEEDGEKKLMMVHDETSGSGSTDGETSIRDDNITGMDFPKLEALVSIGPENRSQRVGRLCRMSRLFMPEKERDAVYVELAGV
eukprot:g3530.t1